MLRFFCILSCTLLGVVFAPALFADEETDQSAPAPAADAKRYDLKYKFKLGETLLTEVVHRATVQTTIQGTTQIAETQSKSIKRWQIEKLEADGTVTLLHSVDSIDMRQKTQGRAEIRYNSETDKEVPPGYEEAAAAVNVPLTMATMDNRGKVLKRFEKRAQPSGMSTQITLPLPAEPVAVGQSWSSPLDIDVTLQDGTMKKIKTRQKFTLSKVDDDLATIAVDSQILSPINDPAIEAQLIQRLSAGTVKFDLHAGRVLSQQLDLDRHVIGFSGNSSSMHYVTRFTERLLDASEQTARRVVPRGEGTKKPDAAAPSAAKPSAKKR
jgi:hypothetical protein